MKKVLIITIMMCAAITFAQERGDFKKGNRTEMREKRKNITPEQTAELKSKELTLKLDLTASQQKQMYTLILAKATERKAKMATQKEAKTLTDSERVAARSAMLDSKIAYKKEMKAILNADQYATWEKGLEDAKKGIREKRRNRKQ